MTYGDYDMAVPVVGFACPKKRRKIRGVTKKSVNEKHLPYSKVYTFTYMRAN